MHASRYTVGQDHTGSWWVIAPGGTTGYEFGPDHHDAEQATVTCEWANERGAEPGVDSADPPPELVGGHTVESWGGATIRGGVVDEMTDPSVGILYANGVRIGTVTGIELSDDLTLRDWDYPAPRSMWDGYAGE